MSEEKLFIKKIYHIAAWNRNIGDWTACYNLHRSLEVSFKKEGYFPTFYLIDSQRTLFHKSLIEEINEEADLILIGPGGMIFNRPQDESRSGWAFNISISDLKKIKIPIVVHGIGYNKFYFDKNKWPQFMKNHLLQLQKQATYFSVRNQGSKEKLQSEFGLIASKIEVVPDCGIYLYDKKIKIPKISKEKIIIGLNWAGDRPEERFKSPWKKNRSQYISALKKTLIKFCKNNNAIVLYIPHLTDMDTDFFSEISKGFPKESIFDLYKLMPYLYVPAGEYLYNHIAYFTNIYRQLSFTIGMRGHACIFSAGANVPFIPLGSHNKLQYFINDLDVENISIRMIDDEDFDTKILYEKINTILQNLKKIKKQLKTSVSQKTKMIDNYNNKIVKIFAGKP